MKTDKILLDHGSGGKMAHRLTAEILLPRFDNPILAQLHDGAVFDVDAGRLAFSTDTFTVDPIFFPGGDIGDLAVNGTVNDIAMCGAIPRYLSLALIIEEGLALSDLERILNSIAAAAQHAGVQIVTGDTKVVPNGAADRIFINTTGVGVIESGVEIGSQRAEKGDLVLLSGAIAEHGVAVMTQREGMAFETAIVSDTAALNHMVAAMIASGRQINVLRDPTRGGVGTALNEIALQSKVGIRIDEVKIPLNPAVEGVCELLGFDPLYLANEGKLLAIVPPQAADHILAAMRADPCGRAAAVIGEVVDDHPGRVIMRTRIGGSRIIDMLAGEQLPRIC